MKLINVNVEVNKHLDKVLPFLDHEQPDAIALQECTDEYETELRQRGYAVTKLEHVKKEDDGHTYTDYDMIATKAPHQTQTHYYYHPGGELQVENPNNRRETNRQGVIVATFTVAGEEFVVATTHFTWGPDARQTFPFQEKDMDELLAYTKNLPPHVLCGDLNLSREHTHLYQQLTEHYTDVVPAKYKSSVDRNIHKLGSDPEKSFIFNSFMVDYLFTQPPYKASNVHLEFGISDHAAVVAEITKN